MRKIIEKDGKFAVEHPLQAEDDLDFIFESRQEAAFWIACMEVL